MTEQTATKAPAPTTTLQEAPSNARRQVAVLKGPRLPYHPRITEVFGIDPPTWKALCESIFPLAKTTDAICLALAYCKARKLDVMKRPVHIVPMWNQDLRKEVETVWPSITEHRITAHRTKQYAGTSATRFGPMVEKHFEDKVKRGRNEGKILKCDLRFPEWAEITCYRMVAGEKQEFPGPRVYFEEFYGMQQGLNVPNARWQRAPSQMLEKCAEAGALRKAFTEELGSEPTAEEMEDRLMEMLQRKGDGPKRPEMKAGVSTADFGGAEDVIEQVVEDEEEEEEDEGEFADEDQSGKPPAETSVQNVQSDRLAEWLAEQIQESSQGDEAKLNQYDTNVRRVIKAEGREDDLLKSWIVVFDKRAAELKAKPPAEEKKAAELSPQEQEYQDWKKDQYATLANAKLTRTIDDLEDEVLRELKEEDRADFKAACTARAKELLKPKGKGK